MCKTNVMHRQEDCMCKHVCIQPTRRSERMSLMERKGRKERKRRDRQKEKGKNRTEPNENH